MGTVPLDEWFQCEWCGWWGYFSHEEIPEEYELLDIDMVGYLCLRCFRADEPPWHPNNRDRCQTHMDHLFGKVLNEVATRRIAEFLADNVP